MNKDELIENGKYIHQLEQTVLSLRREVRELKAKNQSYRGLIMQVKGNVIRLQNLINKRKANSTSMTEEQK